MKRPYRIKETLCPKCLGEGKILEMVPYTPMTGKSLMGGTTASNFMKEYDKSKDPVYQAWKDEIEDPNGL